MPDLLVVLPVYNEEKSVRQVVSEWCNEFSALSINFLILAIDDGSTDSTPEILLDVQTHLPDRLEIIRHDNRGHGQTCLQGYRTACERGIPFVFQIDSDGQCCPSFFQKLWDKRDAYDVLYGHRTSRDDGLRRVVASQLLRHVVWLSTGAWCADPNVPYRLMRTNVLSSKLASIPSDFILANIALAVLLKKDRSLRHGEVPIHFQARTGGEPTVPLSNFASKAAELIRQLKSLPSTHLSHPDRHADKS